MKNTKQPALPGELAVLRKEARKELARRHLIDFACYVNPYYQAAAPHRALAAVLEKVECGEITRLIVNFPRRHGKSLLVSQMFPVWAFGRNPRLRIVQSGYAENLTVVHSRKARDLLAGTKFNELFPNVHHQPGTPGQEHIATPSQTAHEWGTTQGGNYYAVGVGGGLAGRGFHIGIIDDPIRGREDANSMLKRDKVHDWYRSVFYPAQDSDEIKQNAAVIIVMTRWHIDDLANRVQQTIDDIGDKEPWTVLTMPAINERGEALWPERWTIEKLNRIKSVIGGREFSAQYQQSPRPDDGNVLDSRKLIMVDANEVPKRFEKIVRHWDLAFSEGLKADYVCGVKMGMTADNKRYILHMKRIHGRWTMSAPVIRQMAAEDGALCICSIEGNGTQLGYYQEMSEDPRMAARTVQLYQPEGSKEMRASAWGSRLDDNNLEAREGVLYCVRGEWNQELFDEMDYFPNAINDDCVDGVSGAWVMVSSSGSQIKKVELPELADARMGGGRRGLW